MLMSSYEGFYGSCTGDPRPEAPARSLEQLHGLGHATLGGGDRSTVQLPCPQGHVCSLEMWLQGRRC